MPRFSRPVARSRTSGGNRKKETNFAKKLRSQSATTNPAQQTPPTDLATQDHSNSPHPLEMMFGGKTNATLKNLKKKLDTVRSNDSKTTDADSKVSDQGKLNLARSRKS